jgi:thiamine pyrophosphokinase
MTEAPAGSEQPNFLIVTGGGLGRPVLVPIDLGDATVVIAADSGLDVARDAGFAVHHVVGDLDSARPEAVQDAVGRGAILHRHLCDKDATDFELALDLVLELARSAPEPAPSLLVVGPGGGRQDQAFADLLALAGPRLVDLEVTGRFGEADWLVIRPGRPRRFFVTPQEQISLLPVHGLATGVTTSGLRWPLADADLDAGTTRGVSNAAADGEMSVSITGGVLLVCRPGLIADPVEPRLTPYDPSPRDPNRKSRP